MPVWGGAVEPVGMPPDAVRTHGRYDGSYRYSSAGDLIRTTLRRGCACLAPPRKDYTDFCAIMVDVDVPVRTADIMVVTLIVAPVSGSMGNCSGDAFRLAQSVNRIQSARVARAATSAGEVGMAAGNRRSWHGECRPVQPECSRFR